MIILSHKCTGWDTVMCLFVGLFTLCTQALPVLSWQTHGNSGISLPSSGSGTFENTASVIQPSNVAPRFPAVVDPLTQAAVAQVGAVYQAAAAAAYKAVAASGLMPNLSQSIPSLAPQPSQQQQQAGCMLPLERYFHIFTILCNVSFTLSNIESSCICCSTEM